MATAKGGMSSPGSTSSEEWWDESRDLTQGILEDYGTRSLHQLSTQAMAGDVNSTGRRISEEELQMTDHWQKRQRCKLACKLAKLFDEANLREEWLVASLSLVDRAALAVVRSGAHQDVSLPAYPDWLAAVLSALKQSPCENEFGSLRNVIKKLYRRFGAADRCNDPWKQIVHAEIKLVQDLDYRVARPSAADMATFMASVMVNELQFLGRRTWGGLKQRETPAPALSGTSTPDFILMVMFLVEMSAVYTAAATVLPTAVALACVCLALTCYGEDSLPEQCGRVLIEMRRTIDEAEQTSSPLLAETDLSTAMVPRLSRELRSIWLSIDKDTTSPSPSMEKWASFKRTCQTGFFELPPSVPGEELLKKVLVLGDFEAAPRSQDDEAVAAVASSPPPMTPMVPTRLGEASPSAALAAASSSSDASPELKEAGSCTATLSDAATAISTPPTRRRNEESPVLPMEASRGLGLASSSGTPVAASQTLSAGQSSQDTLVPAEPEAELASNAARAVAEVAEPIAARVLTGAGTASLATQPFKAMRLKRGAETCSVPAEQTPVVELYNTWRPLRRGEEWRSDQLAPDVTCPKGCPKVVWTLRLRCANPEDECKIRAVKYALGRYYKEWMVWRYEAPFELERHGWGSFRIWAHVVFENGDKQNICHTLNFDPDNQLDDYTPLQPFRTTKKRRFSVRSCGPAGEGLDLDTPPEKPCRQQARPALDARARELPAAGQPVCMVR